MRHDQVSYTDGLPLCVTTRHGRGETLCTPPGPPDTGPAFLACAGEKYYAAFSLTGWPYHRPFRFVTCRLALRSNAALRPGFWHGADWLTHWEAEALNAQIDRDNSLILARLRDQKEAVSSTQHPEGAHLPVQRAAPIPAINLRASAWFVADLARPNGNYWSCVSFLSDSLTLLTTRRRYSLGFGRRCATWSYLSKRPFASGRALQSFWTAKNESPAAIQKAGPRDPRNGSRAILAGRRVDFWHALWHPRPRPSARMVEQACTRSSFSGFTRHFAGATRPGLNDILSGPLLRKSAANRRVVRPLFRVPPISRRWPIHRTRLQQSSEQRLKC